MHQAARLWNVLVSCVGFLYSLSRVDACRVLLPGHLAVLS